MNFFDRLLKIALKEITKSIVATKEVRDFTQTISFLGGSARTLLNNLLTNPAKVSKQLGSMTKEQSKALGEELAQGENIEFKYLSSSWLVSGEYEQIGVLGVGDLEITTKQGKSYIYPAVPRKVWDAMKSAKGKYGSGAGKVFWETYLRSYKKSTKKQTIAKAFKLAYGKK